MVVRTWGVVVLAVVAGPILARLTRFGPRSRQKPQVVTVKKTVQFVSDQELQMVELFHGVLAVSGTTTEREQFGVA